MPKVSDAMVCQIDLLASLASLIDAEVETGDSQDLMDEFLGESEQGRDALIVDSIH